LFFESCEDLFVDEIGEVEAETWLIPSQEGYHDERQFIDQARLKKEIRGFIKDHSGNANLLFLSSDKRKKWCRWGFDKIFITDGWMCYPVLYKGGSRCNKLWKCL